ncbi:hypothetical protein [Rhodopila sp.]|uniref:hypothetical protein n=1 Tax=Rhodopila sp. TaxID=2480087 RepID=UPI003D114BE4
MSHPQPNRDATKALFITALGCLLPFHAPGFNGDRTLALNAIGELIQACRPAAPEEYDLAGRSLGYAAAAMDSLRLSMQPNLTDSLILQYRRNAIALGRSADQCRKTLEVIRSKRQKQTAQASGQLQASGQVQASTQVPASAQAPATASAPAFATAPRPAPDAPPRPAAPPHPAAPPRQAPPTQPHPPASTASAPVQAAAANPTPAAKTPTQFRSQPEPGLPDPSGRPAKSSITAQAASAAPSAADPCPGRRSAVPPSPYPNSAVIGDPELTTDIAVMMHNAQAMLADLQALGEDAAPATLQAAIARHAMLQAKTAHASNGAIPRAGNGAIPRAGNGAMPRAGNGAMPHAGNGAMPHAGNA